MADCTGVAHDSGQWRTVLVWLMIGVSGGLYCVVHDRGQWRTVLVWLLIVITGGLYWCG